MALANGLLIPAAESKEAVKLKVDWLFAPKVMGWEELLAEFDGTAPGKLWDWPKTKLLEEFVLDAAVPVFGSIELKGLTNDCWGLAAAAAAARRLLESGLILERLVSIEVLGQGRRTAEGKLGVEWRRADARIKGTRMER